MSSDDLFSVLIIPSLFYAYSVDLPLFSVRFPMFELKFSLYVLKVQQPSKSDQNDHIVRFFIYLSRLALPSVIKYIGLQVSNSQGDKL